MNRGDFFEKRNSENGISDWLKRRTRRGDGTCRLNEGEKRKRTVWMVIRV